MADPEAALAELCDHLVATAERPVERRPRRLLGEAEAVATDTAAADLDPARQRERVATVRELLEEIDGTGDEVADEHVATARRLADRILDA